MVVVKLSGGLRGEVVAETFEIAWRKRAELLQVSHTPQAYVFGIAKKCVMREIQRAERQHHDNRFAADHESSTRPSEQRDVADEVVELDTARSIMRSLTLAETELLMLLQADLTGREIADLLEISAPACAGRILRLRQRVVLMAGVFPENDGHGESA